MSIGKATLPQNFIEATTAGLRLRQPEPVYTFSRLAMAAGLRKDAINAGATTAQQFVTMAAGGAVVPNDLQELALLGDIYPAAVISVDGFGKGKGDTIKFSRPVYGGGAYTEAERRLTPDKPISEKGQVISSEDVPLVVHEYTGPATADGEKRPYVIREFDAKYRQNRDQLASLTNLHLGRDYDRASDVWFRDTFRQSNWITLPDGATSLADLGAGSGKGFSMEMVLNAKKALKDRFWRPFPNGKYLLIAPTVFQLQMIGDSDYARLAANHANTKNPIFGYITSIQDVDIIESQTLKVYAAGDSIPGIAGTVPVGVRIHEALMIGPDCVGAGTAIPVETRFSDNTNYGTEARVIWYTAAAFGMLDDRGVQRLLVAEDV